MHINIVSSLEHPNQFGGAALRCNMFDFIYDKLNFSSAHFFQKNIRKSHSLKSIAQTLYFGCQTAAIFKPATIHLHQPGILHLDNLRHFSWIFKGVKPSRIIYNAHNLEFENYFNRDHTKKANRFRDYEISTLKRSDLICLCSQREKELLLSLCPELKTKLLVIPNLVNKNNYSISKTKKTISFIGTLHYYPNIQAINYLCDHFIKEISTELLSHYRFIIAGRDPSPQIIDKIKKSPFELIINPSNEEVRKIFADSLIQLVPICSGSGTRIKISEAVFSGAHILSTPLGREGLNSLLIHESKLEDFPHAIVQILNNLKPTKIHIESFAKDNDLETWVNNNFDLLKMKFLGMP